MRCGQHGGDPAAEHPQSGREKVAVEVVETALPTESLLNARVTPADFLDCYAVPASLSPREAARTIVSFPKWARALLFVRRIVTVPFGLSQDGPSATDKIGPFPVEQESENELIAGFDDKHLDFRIAVLSQDARVYLATWVHPHNIGGRLYLSSILPFHVLIARDALRRVASVG